MSDERKLCFVYGSLLSGGNGSKEGALGNHRVLAGAKFLGEHITEPAFKMLNLGSFPGVVEDGATKILGEVYEITDYIFERLDRLEGYPSFYGRKKIDTEFGKAWIYLLPDSGYLNHTVVEDGNWRGAISRY